MRIGIGYDVHSLCEGRKLVLGGVEIPHTKGLLGHSDADVLTHAICDALLGAAAMGDLGQQFPDTDDKYKNIASLYLLAEVGKKLAQRGFSIANIDSIIIAQEPKLKEYIPPMCKNIAAVLKMSADDVSIKATTTEKLGFVGREEGIAAKAIVLIK